MLYVFFVFSMEQSVSNTANVNHAAELDQILASYKVRRLRYLNERPRVNSEFKNRIELC